MERSQPPLPQKSNSFSLSTSRGLKETDRNFSLGAIRFEDHPIRRTGGDGGDEDDTNSVDKPETIHEGDEEEEGEEEEEKEKVEKKENDDTTTTNGEEKEKEKEEGEGGSDAEETPHTDHDLNTIAEDVDQFLTSLRENGDPSPEILSSTGGVIDKFVVLLEREIIKYESGKEKLSPEHQDNEPSLLDAVDRMSKLTAALAPFSSSDPKFLDATSLTGSVLQHAMSFLEDEFFSLLEESSSAKNNLDHGGKTKRPPPLSHGSTHDQDRCVLSPPAEPNPADSYPSPEIVARLRMIANAMITSGYETECFQVFTVARRNALSAGLSELGFEKISIDDVQRMPWDALETEITKWGKAFRYVVTTSLPLERDLCDSVFAAHRRTAAPFSRHLAFRCVLAFLNFPEALAMIKRSTEKLFKVLDVYEALRDMIPNIDPLFSHDETEEREDEDEPSSSPMATELKSEMSAVQSRLGEAAVAIFCDLESSIKSDVGRNVVPGGAVHPLTRYVMNYLKYACEYIGTLEQIFKEHMKSSDGSSSLYHEDNDDDTSKAAGGGYSSSQNSSGESNQTPFAVQLALVMDLLQANLDSKAKLYKDLALSNIFLMNNRRYILQKIKGSGEISKVLGDNWRRKQSSDLRQYHNNYKRETWSKVVACLKDEGLMVKGSVAKPMLKERFKSFNAMFEEIHKAQSMWVVSDEQLQSELRVSVSAVVVPAYRSFLGRFQQYLDPGRQTEKYIKFAAEDLEAYIDELFDGNPSSMVVKKR